MCEPAGMADVIRLQPRLFRLPRRSPPAPLAVSLPGTEQPQPPPPGSKYEAFLAWASDGEPPTAASILRATRAFAGLSN